MNIDAMAAEAQARVQHSINRSAGQHLRAMREAHHVPPEAQPERSCYDLGTCQSRLPPCKGCDWMSCYDIDPEPQPTLWEVMLDQTVNVVMVVCTVAVGAGILGYLFA